ARRIAVPGGGPRGRRGRAHRRAHRGGARARGPDGRGAPVRRGAAGHRLGPGAGALLGGLRRGPPRLRSPAPTLRRMTQPPPASIIPEVLLLALLDDELGMPPMPPPLDELGMPPIPPIPPMP